MGKKHIKIEDNETTALLKNKKYAHETRQVSVSGSSLPLLY